MINFHQTNHIIGFSAADINNILYNVLPLAYLQKKFESSFYKHSYESLSIELQEDLKVITSRARFNK